MRIFRPLIAMPALFAGACVATQSDIRVLQGDLTVMRSEAAAAQDARRDQLNRLIASIQSTNDSIAALSARVARLRSDLTTSVQSIDTQLLAIQELTGQSQRKLQELRATLDQRPATPTETPAGGTPGPNQLLELARSQMLNGANSSARTALQDLLTNYPTSDVAPDAQFYIAESFAAEGNAAAADSVYQLVVSQYPGSPRAATSLYKRGVAAQAAGKTSEARALFNELLKKYPRSDEAPLARERLNARR